MPSLGRTETPRPLRRGARGYGSGAHQVRASSTEGTLRAGPTPRPRSARSSPAPRPGSARVEPTPLPRAPRATPARGAPPRPSGRARRVYGSGVTATRPDSSAAGHLPSRSDAPTRVHPAQPDPSPGSTRVEPTPLPGALRATAPSPGRPHPHRPLRTAPRAARTGGGTAAGRGHGTGSSTADRPSHPAPADETVPEPPLGQPHAPLHSRPSPPAPTPAADARRPPPPRPPARRPPS